MQFVSSSGQNIYALQAPVPVRHQFTVLFHESGIEKGSHHTDLVPSLPQRVSFAHQPRVVTRMGGAYQTDAKTVFSRKPHAPTLQPITQNASGQEQPDTCGCTRAWYIPNRNGHAPTDEAALRHV